MSPNLTVNPAIPSSDSKLNDAWYVPSNICNYLEKMPVGNAPFMLGTSLYSTKAAL